MGGRRRQGSTAALYGLLCLAILWPVLCDCGDLALFIYLNIFAYSSLRSPSPGLLYFVFIFQFYTIYCLTKCQLKLLARKRLNCNGDFQRKMSWTVCCIFNHFGICMQHKKCWKIDREGGRADGRLHCELTP